MRIGWISSDALPPKAEIGELVFSPLVAITNCEVKLTDDPLKSQTPITTLAQGTKVNWLASMGEWAYVEIDISPIRGFVKVELLAVDFETE